MLKAAAVLVAGLLAGALFVALRPESGDERTAPPQPTTTAAEATTTEPTATAAAPQLMRINVEARNGRPIGGVARVDVDGGTRIELVVRSDAADHVHVHGHDLFADVGPGQPARLRFRATIPGRIEVELEDTHTLLAEISVRP